MDDDPRHRDADCQRNDLNPREPDAAGKPAALAAFAAAPLPHLHSDRSFAILIKTTEGNGERKWRFL